MKTTIIILVIAAWMHGLYMRVPSTFCNEMNGRRSEIDTTVYYTYGVTRHGDTVCAAWLSEYFPTEFEAIPFDTVTLNINDF